MTAQSLPYRIGRTSSNWYALIIVLVVLIGIGIYAYSEQFIQGDIVTGLRNLGSMGGATWGLYVTMYIYLMGLSFAGITLAVLTRLFQWESLKPVSRMAEILAVVAIISGALLVIADVGQPLRALRNLILYARPQSPLFGTFTLVIAGELFAGLVFLYLGARSDAAELAKKEGRLQSFYRFLAAGYKGTPAEKERRQKSSFWLAIAILPLMVVAFSTVGFVFGLQGGRPGWFSALQAPGFIILATLSGLGLLALIAAAARRLLGAEKEIGIKTFQTIAVAMLGLNLISVYFMVAEWLSSFYSAQAREVLIARALVSGEYALLFWLTAALLLVSLAMLLFQYLTRRYSIALVVWAGVLANLAAIGRRYLIVVPSQTHGQLLPYGIGTYAPTWVEYAVVLGALALAALLYSLSIKVFPIVNMSLRDKGAA